MTNTAKRTVEQWDALILVAECQAALDLPNKECAAVFTKHGWKGELLSSWLTDKARAALKLAGVA